ncbi:hypothetical protein HCN44_011384 [Aphidius gifuensis]|uniref:vitamin-K-epoxide reductase (warfarin-sensitive) n=1 Tax=Aphidius gifuensis TaxID=684658 RepID=A0A835CV86_APHGI|nr:vitamin K epoxide reductase complex subunit 1 [Aphidius gifuensis]KAF7994115.1 hypothetical protein HCN44_011384 [Aphidius gifuensis]
MIPTSGKIHKLNTGLVTACVVGLALSYYAYYVETSKEKDSNYEPLCDISEHVSCTKAFMSKYGKGYGLISEDSIFYLPNSLYGLGFYGLVAIISVCNKYSHAVFLLILAVLSNIGTVYLTWILHLLNDICIVCVGTYTVNAIILILSYSKYRIISKPIIQRSAKRKRH